MLYMLHRDCDGWTSLLRYTRTPGDGVILAWFQHYRDALETYDRLTADER